MKRWAMIVSIGCLFMVPALAQAQMGRMLDQFAQGGLERLEGRLNADDLAVVQLGVSPDPIQMGQPVTFELTILNKADHAGRVNLVVKDRDRVISEARHTVLRPGENRIEFPTAGYSLDHWNTCFTVEAVVEHNMTPISSWNQFCALPMDWSLQPRRG
jgi:hypothetical protein